MFGGGWPVNPTSEVKLRRKAEPDVELKAQRTLQIKY